VYPWFVFIHLIGLVLFAFGHGASAFITYRLRTQRDAEVIADQLKLSLGANRASMVGLVLLLIGGAGAATIGDLWTRPWVVASIVVLVAVIVGMYAVGASYYYRLRDLMAGKGGRPPLAGDELAAYLDSRRPDVLGAIGGLGLLALVGLMVLKPG